MNSKERVLTTLSHKEPDRVPYFEQGVASYVASEILGRKAHTGGGGFRRDGIEAALCGPGAYSDYIGRSLQDWGDLIEVLDFDVVTLPWFGRGEPTRKMDENSYFLGNEGDDDWSVVRLDPESDTLYTIDSAARSGDVSFVERRVKAMRESHRVREPMTENSFPELKSVLQRFGGKRAIGGGAGIAIPIEPAWLEAVVLRPDLVGEYLDMQSEIACESIEVQAAMGIDLVWGGGDMANNSGPLYSPDHFRSLVLPRLKRMVEVCHKHRLPYIFRTDGVIWPVAECLFVESGVDGYGEIDKQAGMDLGEVRRRLPHLVLWGNVDCGRTLTSGTVEDVMSETKDCIDKAAPGGGYILGSSNVVHSRVPIKNFLTMIETCREYGRY